MAHLRLRNLCKSFGSLEVVRDVNLDIESGEFVVFVGPSGCGKSTLLRMIAGLERATSGEIEIAGRDVTDEEPYDRGIAMVFQSYALYPHMSVAQNMGFALRLQGVAPDERRRIVERAASVLQLGPLLDRRPAELSGGQRQRVAIGRAIVRDPQVFLFDEPLSNLDAELRVEMRVEIAQLHRSLANTMVYVTHDQTEAMTLATRIVVLRAGRIEQVGAPTALYDDPDNAFVAGFIGSPRMNFLAARAEGPRTVSIAGRRIDLAIATQLEPDAEYALGLRPEHMASHDTAPAHAAAFNVHADVVEQMGSTSYVHGELAPNLKVVAEVRGARPRPGDVVPVAIDPARALMFERGGKRVR